MIKKMRFIAAPFLLVLVLAACSDNEEAAPKEEKDAETTETTSEKTAGAQDTELELPAEKDVVVAVNGEEILGNVYNSVARQLETSLATQGKKASEPENAQLIKDQAITVIVGNKLILQDAADKGYKADDKLVAERLEELKGQFESEEKMNASLEQSGYTMEDMEAKLAEQIIYEEYLAGEVKGAEVSDEQVKEAYDGFVESSEDEAPAYEEMEPTIRQSLEQQNTQQAVYDRIDELKADAEIEVKI